MRIELKIKTAEVELVNLKRLEKTDGKKLEWTGRSKSELKGIVRELEASFKAHTLWYGPPGDVERLQDLFCESKDPDGVRGGEKGRELLRALLDYSELGVAQPRSGTSHPRSKGTDLPELVSVLREELKSIPGTSTSLDDDPFPPSDRLAPILDLIAAQSVGNKFNKSIAFLDKNIPVHVDLEELLLRERQILQELTNQVPAMHDTPATWTGFCALIKAELWSEGVNQRLADGPPDRSPRSRPSACSPRHPGCASRFCNDTDSSTARSTSTSSSPCSRMHRRRYVPHPLQDFLTAVQTNIKLSSHGAIFLDPPTHISSPQSYLATASLGVAAAFRLLVAERPPNKSSLTQKEAC